MGDWYAANLADLGKNDLVRERVFGRSVDKVIKLGMVGTLPSEGQLLYDWNMELWFDSNADAIAYLNSPPSSRRSSARSATAAPTRSPASSAARRC